MLNLRERLTRKLKINTKTKKLLVIVILLVIFGATSSAKIYNQSTENYYLSVFEFKGIPILSSDNIETELPIYTKPDSSQKKLDIGYWIAQLPEEYQNEPAYFIFPKAGTIIPVHEPNIADQEKLIKGKSFNHLPYLQKGAIHHRGISPSKGPGNFTIAGHTSYYKNDTGDFKTNMQGIFLADTGDTILYIEKQNNNTYNRYIYTITKSYETNSNDTSILIDPKDPKTYEFTAYGCSPIGSMEKRRVIKGLLKTQDQIQQ